MKKNIKEKYKSFIRGYDVIDNEIQVEYLNDKTMNYPYSKEKELEILKTMKYQALNSQDLENSYEKNLNFDRNCLIVNSAIITMGLLAYNISDKKTLSLSIATICSFLTYYFGYKYLVDDMELTDIKKLKYYVQNEDKIQKGIANIFPDRQITINDLDEYSMNDLENFVEKDEITLNKKRA